MLSLTLSGCAGTPTVLERPVAPPGAYTEPTPEPTPPAKPMLNRALVKYAAELLQALRAANADKLSIRLWGESLKETP